MKIKKQFLAGVVRVFGMFLVGVLVLSLGMVTPAQAAAGPDLVVHVSHVGNFLQGGVGIYTITVENLVTAADPTTGATITVNDYLPKGLTAIAMSGTGWDCPGNGSVINYPGPVTLTCTSSTVLGIGSTSSAITLTVSVDVDVSTPASVDNVVDVNGGGESVANQGNNNDGDPTTIIQLPDLTVAATHTDIFTQGDKGKKFILTVTNSGTGPTTGAAIQVTDVLPAGLTATDISGTGWACVLVTLTCTRSGVWIAGGGLPIIEVTVNVAESAAASRTNAATVSGGGQLNTLNDTASDLTTIILKPDLIIKSVLLEPLTALGVCPLPSYTPSPTYSPAPLESFCARIKVTNQGGLVTNSNVSMHVYVDRVPVPAPDPENPAVLGCVSDNGDYSKLEGLATLPAGADVTYDIKITNGLPAGAVHAIYAYTDAWCGVVESNEDNNVSVPISIGGAVIKVDIGGTNRGAYPLALGSSEVKTYAESSGPVEVKDNGGVVPIVAAERVIYTVNGVATSYSELMGLPRSKADTSYLFPWYNNLQLNSQLRFGNVGANPTTVSIKIHGVLQPTTYPLAAGASTTATFAVSDGPVEVFSNGEPIIAAIRVVFTVNEIATSYSELMGVPRLQAATSYLFPWYNNLQLNSQLRFGNVGTNPTTISVKIHGVLQPTTYTLAAGASTVTTFPVSDGPVEVFSNGEKIIAAMRVVYVVNGVNTSYSELMGVPGPQASPSYLFPWYNNLQLNSQLRFGNVGTNPTVVSIKIHGILQPTTYTLQPGASTTATFPVSDGPVEVVSDLENIIAALRVVYAVDGTNTSYSELMGLPGSQSAASYLFPWYNNFQLNSQLRFGIP